MTIFSLLFTDFFQAFTFIKSNVLIFSCGFYVSCHKLKHLLSSKSVYIFRFLLFHLVYPWFCFIFCICLWYTFGVYRVVSLSGIPTWLPVSWCYLLALFTLIWNPIFILNVSIGVFYTVTLSYLFLSNVELLWQSFLISVVLSYDSVFKENVTRGFPILYSLTSILLLFIFFYFSNLFLSQRILFFLSLFFS